MVNTRSEPASSLGMHSATHNDTGPASDDFVTVRMSRRGDICVLMSPKSDKPTPALLQHLEALRSIVGGRIAGRIHITAQRFEPSDETAGERILERLKSCAAEQFKFKVGATGYIPMHSVFRNTHMLKWSVAGTEPLEHYYRLVDHLGREVGLKPLYMRRATGARVTALLEIMPKDNPALAQVPLLEPLFYVERLIVTRILAPNEYEVLGEVGLGAS